MIHTVKCFGIVNKAEIDVFLELSCFFDDPADVGNLISGSSAFSKANLNIWKFTVHVLLKPGLENFEQDFYIIVIIIIILIVNRLNLQLKDTDYLKKCKNKTHIYAVNKRPTSDRHRVEVKGQKKIFMETEIKNLKKARAVTLI